MSSDNYAILIHSFNQHACLTESLVLDAREGFMFLRYSSHQTARLQSVYSLADKTLKSERLKNHNNGCLQVLYDHFKRLNSSRWDQDAQHQGRWVWETHILPSPPVPNHAIKILTGNQYFHSHSGCRVTSKRARTREYQL